MMVLEFHERINNTVGPQWRAAFWSVTMATTKLREEYPRPAGNNQHPADTNTKANRQQHPSSRKPVPQPEISQ
jgi:hypothetical protein